jgi:hypothetical protein
MHTGIVLSSVSEAPLPSDGRNIRRSVTQYKRIVTFCRVFPSASRFDPARGRVASFWAFRVKRFASPFESASKASRHGRDKNRLFQWSQAGVADARPSGCPGARVCQQCARDGVALSRFVPINADQRDP